MTKNIAFLDEENVVINALVYPDDYVIPEGVNAKETRRGGIGDIYDPTLFPTTGFIRDEPYAGPDATEPVPDHITALTKGAYRTVVTPEPEPPSVRLDKLEGQIVEILTLLKKHK